MEKDIDDLDLKKLIQPYEVEYLYKYRSMSSQGLERTFTHNEIYYTPPIKFNDPFDCKPNLIIHSNSLKREEYCRKAVKQYLNPINKQQLKREALRLQRNLNDW